MNDSTAAWRSATQVDLFSSFREVRVGQVLLDVPQAPFVAKEYPLEDVEKFLYDEYAKDVQNKLSSLKKQKVSFLNKKLKKLEKLYPDITFEEASPGVDAISVKVGDKKAKEFRLNDRSDYDDFIKLVEFKDDKGDPTEGMTDDEKIEYYLANSN